MSTAERATFTHRLTCISCGSPHLTETCGGLFDAGVVKQFMDEDPWGENPAPFLQGQAWSYVTCQDCQQSFHRNILSPEWNEHRFSQWMTQEAISEFEKSFKTPAHDFAKAAENTAHILRLEQLTHGLRGSDRLRVLDFGCGYGEFLAMCALFGCEAYGVDRSSAKLENNRYAQVFPDIQDAIAFAPFHALSLFEVLEHLDDPRSLMLELRELLMPGGILILETPDCSGIHQISTRTDYYKIHPLDHINGFTPHTLQAFAQRLGFEPVSKPTTYVTCDPSQIIKKTAKSVLGPLLKPTTQQYFRKI